jgi:tRNA nucleotidyltransferase (CCA-adding enzyme)
MAGFSLKLVACSVQLPLSSFPQEDSLMQIYKVGGAVRDHLLGRPVTEVDWVVVGASAEDMLAQGYRPVGADFPVFLHPETGEEYALARTERKSGRGYGGFTFYASPDVSLEEDLIRRDLTINAMAESPEGELVDPYGGQRDLEARLLRHVSPAFAEDPLRVLRVARFAARYAPLGFRVAPDTQALMRQLSESGELDALTPERSWKEISRALMEPRPDVFIEVLRDCGALAALFPEIDALFGVPQPAQHHPEIDTGAHVLAVLSQCAEHDQPLTVRWACLLHDLGKGLTPEAEWPKHHAHEATGRRLIAAVNARCKAPRDCQELALLVGEYHTHAHRALELRPNTLLELLQYFDIYRRPQRFEEFLAACEMDARGRKGLEQRDYPQASYLRGAADAARAVSVQPLLEKGLQGAELGEALRLERLKALKAYKARMQSETDPK